MKFARRSRLAALQAAHEEDPLAGIANLFDISVAFIVALLIALMSMTSMQDLLNPNAQFTLVKENANGTMEIITKERSRIRVQRVTDKSLSGRGTRLGTAYRLAGGEIVYVPDER